MARVHLLQFPSTVYSLTLPKPQTQPLLVSSLYNNKPNSHHLPAVRTKNPNPLFYNNSAPFTRYPHSVSSLVADVISQAEPEVAAAGEEEFSNIRVMASNIPWTWTPEDVRAVFEKFGAVVDIELSMHNQTRNRGLVFVSMGSPEEALAAFQGLELKELDGRVLKMNWAKLRKKKPSPPPQPKGLMFSLFVANLPYTASNKDLRELFISEGFDATSAEVMFHENPRKPTGDGFVRFKSRKQAEDALIAFQGKKFDGRPLRVSRAKPFARLHKDEDLQPNDTPVETISETISVTEQADSPDGN